MNLELQDIERIAELPYKWEELNGKTIMISGGTGFMGTVVHSFRWVEKNISDQEELVTTRAIRAIYLQYYTFTLESCRV